MSDVTLTFGGDDKDAQRAWDRQSREIAKLKEKIADLGKTAKKSGDDGKKGTDGHVESLSRMATGLVNIGTVVGFVSGAYGQWAERMKKLAEDSNKFHGDLLRTLSKAGDLADAGKIKAALRGIEGVKQEEALEAFNAVSGSAPATSVDRRLALTKGVARMAPLEDVTQLGALTGEMAGILPGASPEDVVDASLKMREQVGAKDADKLSGSGFVAGTEMLAKAAGISKERALGIGVESVKAEMDPRIIQGMAAAIDARESNIKKGGKLTAQDKLKNQFGRAKSDTEALEMLESNPELFTAVMGDMKGAKGGQIDFAAAKEREAELKKAMAGDEVGQRLSLAATADPSTFAGRAAAIETEQEKYKVEEEGRKRERAWERGEAHRADMGMIPSALSYAIQGTAEALGGTEAGVEFGTGDESFKKFLAAEERTAAAVERAAGKKSTVVKGGEQ